MLSAIYLINRLPSHTTKNKSPYYLLHRKTPDYNHLKTFGCTCYPLLPTSTRHKLQPRTTPCLFLGYPSHIKGYKCMNLQTGQILISRNVIFDENTFPYQSSPNSSSTLASQTNSSHTSPLLLTPTSLQQPTKTPPSPDPIQTPSSTQSDSHNSTYPITSNFPETTPHSFVPAPPPPYHPMITRTKTGSLKPKVILNLLHQSSSPATPTCLSQALKHQEWRSAMSQEFNALQSQGTWDLVPPPSHQTILGSRWTFRTKHHADGSIARHKARLVAQGHKQQPGIDYNETFSHVAKLPTIRVLLTIAVHHNWPILQFDVSNAFLHGTLHDTVYMHQPPGFSDPQYPNHVCLLKKAIYGLKQAPRQWFTTFSTHLLTLGFQISQADPSLLTYHCNTTHIYLLIYVDDILITGNSQQFISSLISNLQTKFNIKVLGNIHHFLGIHILHTSNGLQLNQTQYAETILQRAGMSTCRPIQNPLSAKQQIPTKQPSLPLDPLLYR